MRTRRKDNFPTIRVEGHILPADLIQRIAETDASLGGLTPESFHLTPNEKINEATNRSWNKLLGAWANFRVAAAKLPENDPGTSVTRERWLLPLFQELGYGRLPAAKAVEVGGRNYAISHWWGNVPIHLVGANVGLDKATAGVAGAARSSPHSLVQELLNRSDESLWGFVSNGLRLRILRDSVNFVRQAYVEFDLEAMMEGEAYSDFVMLWLLCHQSRVEGERTADYWLERWSLAAQEQGVRALEHLREGVEEAITALGRGYLAHRANAALRDRLRSGQLDKQDYYRQLLRLVYRLLFLFVAEDREVLLDPKTSQEAQDRYTKYYSTTKLRHLAERRYGTRHSDLYMALRLVMEKLGGDAGCPELGLPALGSFLFSAGAIRDLNDCEIANHDLLDAIRALAFTDDRGARRQVDYKNLGSEELGSVYESLLELHPELNVEAAVFSLSTTSGNERKTSGSYYTPSSLINSLLDSALEPVLEEAAKQTDAEAALLNLKICDPACGSGHFLIAAAHRLAKRLAQARTGDAEPSPEAVRHALRDVVGRCIYGVDINPMAVELCKVSLWMEAVEPGKPLSFLDHHILCGNSLLGTTPALIKKGIPDEAFKPIEGDDPAYCREYKRRNRDERQGQRFLPDVEHEPWRQLGNLATSLMSIDEIADDTIEGVRQRQKRYESLVNSSDYRYGGLLADAWCAAFVWKKRKSEELPYPITEEEFRRIEESPFNVPKWMEQEIMRLAAQYQFFHWHIAFPGVFRVPSSSEEPENIQTEWSGGFDVVLGNPPWEHTELKEKEWFATRRPDIANAGTGAARKRMIDALAEEDPVLFFTFLEDRRFYDGISYFISNSGRYPLCGRGRINTYAIFAESMRLIQNQRSRVGCIVPSGIATDDTTKLFFQTITQSRTLVSLYDFENREGLFPGVHGEQKFCLLTITGSARPVKQGSSFVFFAHSVADLSDEERRFTLSAEDIALLNPNTQTCSIFRSKRDAELNKEIYRRLSVLVNDAAHDGNPWNIRFRQGLFNMTSDSGLFWSQEKLESEGWQLRGNIFFKSDRKYAPLYEGKLTHIYDHRYTTFDGVDKQNLVKGNPRESSLTEHQCPEFQTVPRYWVAEEEIRDVEKENFSFFLTFHRVANPNNERSAIYTIVPWAGIGDSLFLILDVNALDALLLCSVGNSFVYDYLVRCKVGSRNFNFFIAKQIAVPSSKHIPEDMVNLLRSSSLELTYTAFDLADFANDCGYNTRPFRWDDKRRFLLQCELDAAYFHIYGIKRSDVEYIMETFPTVKRNDKQKYDEYRTKRVILEIYDEMAKAIATGEPYQTRLDPPPADPRVAHPAREEMEHTSHG